MYEPMIKWETIADKLVHFAACNCPPANSDCCPLGTIAGVPIVSLRWRDGTAWNGGTYRVEKDGLVYVPTRPYWHSPAEGLCEPDNIAEIREMFRAKNLCA